MLFASLTVMYCAVVTKCCDVFRKRAKHTSLPKVTSLGAADIPFCESGTHHFLVVMVVMVSVVVGVGGNAFGGGAGFVGAFKLEG